MIRVGIDVGGTNTDAVLMDGKQLLHWVKTPTTADVTGGVLKALELVLSESGFVPEKVGAVMIGTTHFTNAIVQRRGLVPTAVIRLGLPATQSLPPMVDWPEDLRTTLGEHIYLVHGGLEFDGRPISPLNPSELRRVAEDIRAKDVHNIAISAVFSPIKPEIEAEAARIVCEVIPDAKITLSSEIGRIGLIERENAAILNASLQDLGRSIVRAFSQALRDAGIHAPFYLTQNDGTLMNAGFAEKFPVLTIASGPTNSMRGAAFLSGIKEAIVVDVGGTTTDVGALHQGFPRQASIAVELGGVRTNFRMPDVFSLGLGGGSIVERDPLKIGPQSVGFRLTEESLVFGGNTLTATDIAVAAGMAKVGDAWRVKDLDSMFVEAAVEKIQLMLDEAVDRMLLSPEPVPVIVVGGGTILVRNKVGNLPTIKPNNYPVANAVGAAIAQISGEVDRVYALANTPREKALEEARSEAKQRAVGAGADPCTVEIVEIEDVPLAYLPGNATRIRVKAVGDLRHA
jgi:N-methylhydantoinase A/oxoprolinase/acetone carboxylase beta subunit